MLDQLRVHPHFPARPLHAAFEEVRDAQLLADLAQVATGRLAILHHARAANDLQVGDLSQIGQDFILHAIGEKSVLLVAAQVFEGQDSDGFFRDRNGVTA